MFRCRRRTIVFAPLIYSICHLCAAQTLPPTPSGQLEFDASALRTYGLDGTLADYFASGAKFTPGEHVVALKVNGVTRGLIRARFNHEGQICTTPEVIDRARLITKKPEQENPCNALDALLPGASVTYNTANNEVAFLAPSDAVSRGESAKDVAIHGGTAGMLNYSVFGTRNEYNNSSRNNINTTLEAGLNFNDWIIRSTQLLSDASDESFNHESLYTYAQRTFADYGVVAQGGEINVYNSPFSIPTLYGLQIFPETGLNGSGSGVEVQGIARSSQARIDVRQNNQLIYTTLVPAGPFTLKDLPIISNNADLDVTVVESDNAQQRFTVPASTFRGQRLGKPVGLSVALGRVKEIDTPFSKPWVGSVSDGWLLAMNQRLEAGVMFADNRYYAASASLDSLPVEGISTRMEIIGAVDNDHQRDGTRQLFDAYWSTPWYLAFSAGLSHRDKNYRELLELYNAEDDTEAYEKYETHLGVSLPGTPAGVLSLTWYRSEYWDESDASERLSLSWSKTFKYASLNVSWQTGISNSDSEDDEDMLYIGMSVPLGGSAYTSSWYREYNDKASYGTRLSSRLTENSDIAVGVQRDQDSDINSWDASLNSNLHYTTMSLSTSSDSDSNHTYSATLNGGMVAHQNGLTFSPYKVSDTFGVVSLDKPLSGVEIETSRGRVWTDFRGQAVIAAIPPYQKNALNLNTQSLPGNVDVMNGKTYLNTSHGAVASWQFETLSQRRVMFTLTRENGQPLPRGTSIVNSKGDYITSAPEDGMVFINDVSPDDHFYARLSADAQCELKYALPEEAPDTFYEEIVGTCRDVTGKIQ
ncbi:fimbrial biogenesis usher protein [Enterobacter sp.]|uniref:fimbrial biogenesis usher protein n=1 Tax=Enterobacter sp. TaxID=42895 RepID=UPI00296E647A|nr:fimbrial biogenesis usher protein [Enterobacter sp.]